ncbi:hypothetical protein FQN50_008261 [Emmonsiellopsis sp. PD_5]|nr:hypothetical protein FQN50_008261 [Emmonsiellopsis sp. PD_5]
MDSSEPTPQAKAKGKGKSKTKTPRPISLCLSTPPTIPERYASLLAQTSPNPSKPTPKPPRLLLHPSPTTTLTFTNTNTSTTIPALLSLKTHQCRTELDYLKHYQSTLRTALLSPTNPLNTQSYADEMAAVDRRCRPLLEEFAILTRQRRALEQDLTGEVVVRRHKLASITIATDRGTDIDTDPDTETGAEAEATTLLSKAYASALFSKGLGTNMNMNMATQHATPALAQARFRRDVLSYYGAARTEEGESQMYCPITGWWDAGSVRVARLVPVALATGGLARLFGEGAGEVAVGDRRNGIPLHAKIESAMNAGVIAIVPVPPTEPDNRISGWKCILTNESYRDRIFSRDLTGHGSRWNELDHKPLTFQSDARPAARFLFFRFVMTYLQAKMGGNVGWAQRVESGTAEDLWPAPADGGEYLERSMFAAVARNVCGFEVPEGLCGGLTFDGEQGVVGEGDDEMVLAMRLREVLMEGMRGVELGEGEGEGEGEGVGLGVNGD